MHIFETITLSPEAWEKIQEIDNKPVDIKVVKELKEKMKRIYNAHTTNK